MVCSVAVQLFISVSRDIYFWNIITTKEKKERLQAGFSEAPKAVRHLISVMFQWELVIFVS